MGDLTERTRPLHPRAGQKSIDKLLANSTSDRIRVQRNFEKLQYASSGAPGTVRIKQLWITRFEAFRKHTLQQDVTMPFSGNDLVLFLDAIIDHIDVHDIKKPAPSEHTILCAAKVLVVYGHSRWREADGFKIEKHDAIILKTFLNQAVKECRLVRGFYRAKTWIGFVTLSRIVRAFLERALVSGTNNWDVVIAKCLSIVLVAALGARSGDVARSQPYTGDQYIHFRDVVIELEGNVPEFVNLRATITIKFAKGFKDIINDDQVHYMRPIADISAVHVCPLALLITHALRHGLVAGSTVNEVLLKAVARADRRVEWLFPHRPILTAFSMQHRCELDKPAGAKQLLCTIKEMGIVAGMLSRAYTHALRNGAARHIANLPNLTLQEGGFSSDLVRQSIGHTAGTSNSGITERYVGGHSADIWHDRVTNPKIHRREPQFAAPTSVTPFQAVHAPDTDDDVEITGSNLSRRTKRRRVLIERTANLAQTFAAEPNSVSMDTLKKPSPHPKIKSAGKPAIESESNVDLRDIVNMDPRLLSEQDLDLLTVRHEEVLAMRSTLLADNHCDGNDKAAEICDISLLGYGDSAKVAAELAQPENDEATRLVLHEPQDLENDTVIVYAHEWVDLFAKYNSVMNRKFAEQFSKGVVDLSEFACLGNSRDPPQLFFFRCQKSRKCPYKSTTRKNVASHERNCDEVTVQSAYQIASALQTELLSCPYDGCDYVTSCGKETLRTHVSKHKWAPRACEHGCDAAIIYNDHQSYKSHLRSKHSAGYPTKCSYPDCAHPTEFTSRDGLRIHLFKTHGLDRDSALPYFPQLAEKRKWKKYQHCPISGCVSKASFKAANILVEHMTKKHNMTPEEAKDYVYENAEFETYVPDIKVGSARKRGPTTQTVVAALNHHNEQI